MSTIDSKELIDSLIADNGYYYDDPRVYMIVEYTNYEGNIAWGVTWITENSKARTRYLEESQYIRNPRVIWHSENKT